jgi:hypothetical protein
MKLDMFNMQINEDRVNNKIHDMSARVKELRALNNKADTICKKVASEFGKDYVSIKKYLLPQDLKRYAGMTDSELGAVGEDVFKKLKRKYSKCASNARSKVGVLKNIMNGCIEKNNGRME